MTSNLHNFWVFRYLKNILSTLFSYAITTWNPALFKELIPRRDFGRAVTENKKDVSACNFFNATLCFSVKACVSLYMPSSPRFSLQGLFCCPDLRAQLPARRLTEPRWALRAPRCPTLRHRGWPQQAARPQQAPARPGPRPGPRCAAKPSPWRCSRPAGAGLQRRARSIL